MKAADIMQTRVATVRPEDTVSTALQLMRWADVRHLPVISEEKVVGVLSERDILSRGEEGRRDRVAEAMSSPAKVTFPDADVDAIALEMTASKLGCLPVVGNGRLLGIITRSDIIARRAASGGAANRSPVTVGEAMSPQPLVGRLDDRLLDAAARMQQNGIRHLPIVDADGRVVAMLSDRDVRTAMGDPDLAFQRTPRAAVERLSVADAASQEPITIEAARPLEEAIRLFATFRVGALPVTSETGRLEGILSYVDVMRSLVGGAARVAPLS